MDEVRRAYGEMARPYIELFGSTEAMHADDLDLIVRNLSLRPGPVLDAGCGPGHLTAHLCSLGIEATGLDLTPEFVAHARGAHACGRYEVGSMARLPVADGSLAGIVAWYSLIHTPPEQLDAVLAELRLAVAPGGRLVVGFFDGDEVAPFAHKVVTAWFWPVDELASRLRSAGFEEVERQQRPGEPEPGPRAHGAIAVTPAPTPPPLEAARALEALDPR